MARPWWSASVRLRVVGAGAHHYRSAPVVGITCADAEVAGRAQQDLKRQMQLVYQVDVALNPRQRLIETILGRGEFLLRRPAWNAERAWRTDELVELPKEFAPPDRALPDKAARVCVARALAADPDLIDELRPRSTRWWPRRF